MSILAIRRWAPVAIHCSRRQEMILIPEYNVKQQNWTNIFRIQLIRRQVYAFLKNIANSVKKPLLNSWDLSYLDGSVLVGLIQRLQIWTLQESENLPSFYKIKLTSNNLRLLSTPAGVVSSWQPFGWPFCKMGDFTSNLLLMIEQEIGKTYSQGWVSCP